MARGRLAGVRMVLGYNWPLYLAGVGAAAAGALMAAWPNRRPLVRATGAAVGVGAGWLAVASLAATWWVYDRSELYRWTWLAKSVPVAPHRVMVVHAGLDEASGRVKAVWPSARVESVDVHGGIGATTGSLRRARTETVTASSLAGRELAEADVVVAFLAAHEIRTADGRTQLLSRIRRSLRPGGRLVLVEHIRDLANVLVYGPAVGHFYPVDEWRRAVTAADLTLVSEERITPFVCLLSAQRPA